MNVSQAVHSHATALLADVRPLRAIFEDLVLQVRFAQPTAGVAATLILRYHGHANELTVPIELDAESGAVCISDPLPLDRAALQGALATFHAAHAARYGYALKEQDVEVMSLQVATTKPISTNFTNLKNCP